MVKERTSPETISVQSREFIFMYILYVWMDTKTYYPQLKLPKICKLDQYM